MTINNYFYYIFICPVDLFDFIFTTSTTTISCRTNPPLSPPLMRAFTFYAIIDIYIMRSIVRFLRAFSPYARRHERAQRAAPALRRRRAFLATRARAVLPFALRCCPDIFVFRWWWHYWLDDTRARCRCFWLIYDFCRRHAHAIAINTMMPPLSEYQDLDLLFSDLRILLLLLIIFHFPLFSRFEDRSDFHDDTIIIFFFFHDLNNK